MLPTASGFSITGPGTACAFKDKTHVAVLMVESATGRYRSALDALAEYLPLVVIELRAWRGEAEVILVPETVVINENLDVAGPAGTVAGAERSEADWQSTISGEAWTSTRPSSLGARPVSAKCASTTVPSLISASAAAVEYGHRCGHARMVPSFTYRIPTGCTASNSRQPWMCSRNDSVRTASRPTGSPPTTRVLTRSQSGFGKRI